MALRHALRSLLLVPLAACATSHDPGDGGGEAGLSDAIVPDASPPATVQVTLGEASFTTCYCHHGCGPGADGWVEMTIANDGREPVAVRLMDVVLVPEAGGDSIATAPEEGGGQLTMRIGGDGPDPLTRIVPAGGSLDGFVRVTIDLADDPETIVGEYRARLHLEVAGDARVVSTDVIAVSFAGGC